jgi:hypothetical protein
MPVEKRSFDDQAAGPQLESELAELRAESRLRRVLQTLARDVKRRPPVRGPLLRVAMWLPVLGPALARSEVVARARELLGDAEWLLIEYAAEDLGPDRVNVLIGQALEPTGFYMMAPDGTLWACTPAREDA